MATRSTRGKRPRPARRSDVPRALFACLFLGALVGLAVFETRREPASTASPNRTAAAPTPAGSDPMATGSIVFVPMDGDHCRKRLIDNATWRIRDDGEVDCTTALNQDANGRPLSSVTRIEVIRQAFRKQ